jgi:peptidoglycan/LPS O-acetylase OafA/YrhL
MIALCYNFIVLGINNISVCRFIIGLISVAILLGYINIKSKFLIFIGSISYEIYLIHDKTGIIYIEKFLIGKDIYGIIMGFFIWTLIIVTVAKIINIISLKLRNYRS